MMKRPALLVLLLAISLPFSYVFGAQPANLTILHVNDLHGHIIPFVEKSVDPATPMSGAAYLAAAIERERAKNPRGAILLSAGDMFQGTPISNVLAGKPVIEIMNYLKFDAMALGNHEFDWGRNALHGLIASAKFPFLSANIIDVRRKPIKGTKPYIIPTRNGIKVAVIGVTTPETIYTTKPGNVSDLRFSEPSNVLPGIIQEVRKHGAKTVVVLSHLGIDADEALARSVPGIDVIVGGHTHTVAVNPVTVGETIIVQAGYYGLFLGVLELKIDPSTGKVLDYTKQDELKPIYAGPNDRFDPKVALIVKKHHDRIKEAFSKSVGAATVDLLRNSERESNIGNLISDAMRDTTGADIAIQNGGGIRADILSGDITLEEVYSVLPFDNLIVTMDLSGRQIAESMERNAAMAYRILQVSGMKVRYDMKKPVGSRVESITVGDRPLDPTKIYRVTVNDFLAAGGDQFTTFREGQNLVYGDTLRDVFTKYLKKHSPVSPKIEGRMEFVGL